MKARERTFAKRKVKAFATKQLHKSNEKFTLPNGVLEEQPNKKKDSTLSTIDPNLIHYHWYVFEEPGFTEPTTSSAKPSSEDKGRKPESSTYHEQESETTLTKSPSNSNGANTPFKESSFISTYPSSGYGYGYHTQRPTKYEPYFQDQEDFGWNYSLEEQDDYKKPLLFHKLFQTLGPILFPLPFILAMIPFLVPLIPLTIMAHMNNLPAEQLPLSLPNNTIIQIPSNESVNSTPTSPATVPTKPPSPASSTPPSQSNSNFSSSFGTSSAPSGPPSTTSSPGQGNPSTPAFPPLNPLPFPMLPGFPGIPRNGSVSTTTTDLMVSTKESKQSPSTTTEDYKEITSIVLLSATAKTDTPTTITASADKSTAIMNSVDAPETKFEKPESNYKKILQSLNVPQSPYEIIKVLIPDLMSIKPLIYLNDTFDYSYDRKKSKL